MLLKRVLTAAVLIPLLVVTILYGRGRPFGLLVAAAVALCAAEYFRMFFPALRDRATGILLAGLAYVLGAFLPGHAAGPALLAVGALAAFHALPGGGSPAEKVRSAGLFLIGTLYIGGSLAAWVRTRGLPGGEHWVLAGLVAVAAGDTAAYFVGRAAGRRPLAPLLSPNKTVEGAAGGLAASALLGGLYAGRFLPGVAPWFAWGTCAAVGAVGQAGDLFESLLKRAAGVKDSGAILPGHGGMLDRADAVIAAGPLLYLLAILAPLAGSG